MLLFLLLCVFILIVSSCDSDSQEQRISAAMISGDTLPKRFHEVTKNFTQTLLASIPRLQIKYWPAPLTSCSSKPVPSEEAALIYNEAHYAIWQDFSSQKNLGCKDRLIVFQYDGAVIGRDNAGLFLMESVKIQTADIMYWYVFYPGPQIYLFLTFLSQIILHPGDTALKARRYRSF